MRGLSTVTQVSVQPQRPSLVCVIVVPTTFSRTAGLQNIPDKHMLGTGTLALPSVYWQAQPCGFLSLICKSLKTHMSVVKEGKLGM